MISKHSAIAWLVLVIVLCSLSAYQMTAHWRIQTDILALLPQDQDEPLVQIIRRMVTGELGRTTLFLASHPQSQIARDATRQLGQLMEASRVFSAVQWDYRQQQKAFFEFYFPFRYQFMSPTIRAYLSHEQGYLDLIDHLTNELYRPFSSLTTRLLADDPLLLFPQLISDFGRDFIQLGPPERNQGSTPGINDPTHEDSLVGGRERTLTIEEGMLGTIYKGRHYYVITAQLAANPFEADTQVQLEESWRQWSNQLLQSTPGLELNYTAVARFASAMRNEMQADMFLISVGSTVGIILLIVFVFRSVKHLIVAFIPLAIGLYSAIGLSLLVFEDLHVFTLVFGSSLIGVCIDYSLHYFSYHRIAQPWDSIRTMQNIFPAVGLGALTTILSYIAIGFTPLNGLRQIAFFSSLGIIISFFSVVFWYPFLLKSVHPLASRSPAIYQWLTYFLRFWSRHDKIIFTLLTIAILLSFNGLSALQVSDSPLVLKSFSPQVSEEDRSIRDIMDIPEAQQYLLVTGKTPEDVLQRLENFQDYLYAENPQFGADLGPLITAFLPSEKRQRDNVNLMKTLLTHKAEMSSRLEAIGLPESSIQKFFRDVADGPQTFLTPEGWLSHDVSVGLRSLWVGHIPDGTAIVVKLQHVTDVNRIKAVIASFDGIRYVDNINDFSLMLATYRKGIMVLVSGAYVVILALLIWRYHLQGFIVMLPPLLSAGMTVGMLGLLGHTFHVLHCLSLLLVLGMGVDYAIFLAESDPTSDPTTFLALTLATATTILSFGLLSFSSQAALKAIGFTTFVGIFWVWILSPLAMYGRSR
jgi:predicted exporter